MHDLKNIIIQDENQHSFIELKIKANVRLRCKGISISVFVIIEAITMNQDYDHK